MTSRCYYPHITLDSRAQNSYMAGSTSPSSLIQTACFLGAEISVFTESFFTGSTTAVVSASENAVKNARKRNNFVNIFISSMYKDLISYEHLFCEKKHVLAKKMANAVFF